jgi:hypothetical protein
LVYFVAIWYISSRFGMLRKKNLATLSRTRGLIFFRIGFPDPSSSSESTESAEPLLRESLAAAKAEVRRAILDAVLASTKIPEKPETGKSDSPDSETKDANVTKALGAVETRSCDTQGRVLDNLE